jgi:hypothetical protein
MRQFVFLAASLACAAGAAQAEDRFGPQPAAVGNERAALIYDTGSALSWSGKTQPQSAAASDIRTLQPTPLADGLLRNTSASPYARLTAPQPAAQTPAPARALALSAPAALGPIAPAQPRFPQYTPVAPLGAPAPVPAPVAQVAAASPLTSANGTATLPTSLFDAPARPAEAAPAVTNRPRVAANATGANAPVGSRLYSVHAGYGMDPDPIPLAQTGVGQ